MILEDLQIGYGSAPKEKKIGSRYNLTVEPGKFHVILGQNGEGKSSLLRTLAGVQNPLSGKVILDKENLHQLDLQARAKLIGLVLTEKIPQSHYSVEEYLALGRYPYTNWMNKLQKQDQLIIEEVLEQIKATHLKGRKVSELSDGEQQKIQIAKVLVQQTPYILLDEPTAHLDIHHKIQLFKILKDQVKDYGKTIIMASHEVNLSLELADQLILLIDQEYYDGTSEYLINNKIIHRLFPKDLIVFNENLAQFTLAKSKE